jgi:hypothetical protein
VGAIERQARLHAAVDAANEQRCAIGTDHGGLDGRARLLDISRSIETIENEVGASAGERAG